MNTIKKAIGFLRWRLVGVRHVSMLANVSGQSFVKADPSTLPSTKNINEKGFDTGPTIDGELLKEIQDLYQPRIADVVPKPTGHPFKNLMTDEDISIDNPVVKLAFSKEILDPAMDYFGNKVQFESLQVLYSYPTNGKLRESQMWHKDFGDNKSFHAIVYLNDVLEKTQGPFVFVSKQDSKKIRPSILIRRVDDERFFKELGDGKVEYFYGKSGETVFVDPAKCYHYGSRCQSGRLALFFTFNTSTPFMIMPSLIKRNKEKLFEIGKTLRPDINETKLKNLLRL